MEYIIGAPNYIVPGEEIQIKGISRDANCIQGIDAVEMEAAETRYSDEYANYDEL